MSLGTLFLIAAVVFFFLAAIGSALMPNPTAWGLLCFTIGHLVGGVAFPVMKSA